jgi:predicted nucleotidyltransferase component of viral defense system
VDPLEKAVRLLELLETLRKHPYLKDRLVLKGGTALNLFVFDVPRLSVDIDLNYVGASDRETMLAERPIVEDAIRAVCARVGIDIKRVPSEHAGGKWRISFTTATGRSGALELDVNFLLRVPIWSPIVADSRFVHSSQAVGVRVLDVHELAAGKLSALFSRSASRDVFDVHRMLSQLTLTEAHLRLGFIVYGGISRRDWRSVSLEDVYVDSVDVERQLLPLLRTEKVPTRADVTEWTVRLVSECRDLLSVVLPLRPEEMEFLSVLNERGDIAPELLTSDPVMQETIRRHPGLLWKARNVREYRGRM